MKKTLLLAIACAALLLASNGNAIAQAANHAVKINILGAVVGQYQLAYEHAMSEKLSLQLSAGFIGGSSSVDINGTPWYKSTRTGMIVMPEVRYYFSEGLRGLYGGAFARYRTTTWDVDDMDVSDLNWSYKDKRNAIGGGVMLGYQILAGDAFCLDIFLGPQYKSITKNYEFDVNDGSVTEQDIPALDLGTEGAGVGVRFGFNIGVAF